MEVAVGGRRRRVSAAEGVPVMIREIFQNYHLPMPPYSMTLAEIRFWYDPLMPSLIEMQNTMRRKAKV